MITLTILLFIATYFIDRAIYRRYLKLKSWERAIVDNFGYLFGGAMLNIFSLVIIIYLIVKYLP